MDNNENDFCKAQQLLETYFPEKQKNAAEMANKLEKIVAFEEALQGLMAVCGDDPQREGVLETPYRMTKAMLEYTAGYREEPKQHLEKMFDVPYQELVVVKDIEFYSMCEHHLAPFFGVAHVGYFPGQKITGLSKIARMVEGYARRFQVQERLTTQIVEALEEVLTPAGVMVVVEAKHLCMCSRGVKKSSAVTLTSATRGAFTTDSALRAEFLSLIK